MTTPPIHAPLLERTADGAHGASSRTRRRPGRSARRLLMPFAGLALLAVAACSSDSDQSPVSSIPRTSSTVEPTTPPSSGNEPTPGDSNGTQGATPGQDGEVLDPPGGTTPVPDPGGDGGGNNGNQTE